MDSLPSSSKDVVSRKYALSSYVKGGIGLMIAANVDMLVAFSTAYWATWRAEGRGVYGGYGLWKVWHCAPAASPLQGEEGEASADKPNEVVCHEKMADFSFPGWYMTTQVCQTLALAGFLASVIMLLLYAFFPHWQRKRLALASLIAISYLSGILVMVAICVFSFKVSEEIQLLHRASEWFLSWSFSLCCTAFVMNQIAASILITETKRLSRLEAEESQKPVVRQLSQELQAMLASPSRTRDI